MVLMGLLEGVVVAASAGTGCGGTCGLGIGAFLPGYLMTHTKSVGESMRAFVSFYIGKMATVAVLCVISSCIGRTLIGPTGYIGRVKLEPAVDVFMLAMGVCFAVNWGKRNLAQRKSLKSCSCNHCDNDRGSFMEKDREVSHIALMGLGAGYGATPCGPLLVMMGVCSTISPIAAAVSGSVFAASSAVAPFVMLAVLSGLLSPALRRELPGCLTYFQLLAYVILIVVYAMNMVRHFM